MKFNLLPFKNNKQRKIMNALFALFAIGLVMIFMDQKVLPKNVAQPSKNVEAVTNDGAKTLSYSDVIKEQLEKELTKIEGVGKVDVMLTMKTKGEMVLGKDTPTTSSTSTEVDHEGGSRESKDNDLGQSTVIIRNGDGSEQAIVVKEYLPEVSGILIIAEGGDDPIVKNDLINAAKVLLDLPAHKIEVMKMVTN
ncbi:MAG: hypothetical protein H7X94_13105 [Vallitaleaceae bacterium]|nr:hypothetical protein [Vallitaleaceae bacterium]